MDAGNVGGIVDWHNHYGKQYGHSSKKFEIDLLYDPAIPLLDVCPEKTKLLIFKDIYSLTFIAVLFIVAKIWKQPRCPLIGGCVKKIWLIYTMECYLAITKNRMILSFATMCVSLQGIMLSEICQSQNTM